MKVRLLFLLLVFSFLGCSDDNPIDDIITIDDLDLTDNYSPDPSFKVVGYLPTYRFSETNNIDFSALNYVNIAFGNLDNNGMMTVGDGISIKSTVSYIKSQGPKVLLSIGGGGFSEQLAGNWLAGISKAKRKETLEGIIRYLKENNFDGIDVDFEGEMLNRLGANYTALIEDLKMFLHHEGMAITAAVHSKNWHSFIPKSAFQEYDFLNVMTYDATGPWRPNDPGPHSSIEFTMSSLDYWINEQNNPKEKVVMGIPFYGRSWDLGEANGNAYTYRTLIESDVEVAYRNQTGLTYYDGIPMIVEKVSKAIMHTNGIMIWELGQDSYNDLSLLRAAKQVLEHRECVEQGKTIITYYMDADNDGLGDPHRPIQDCTQPQGYVENRNDDDDSHPMSV